MSVEPSEHLDDDTGVGVLGEMDRKVDTVCNFSIMDVIEDDCRVRMLNVWAFLLVYVFFVLALLQTVQPSAQVTGKVVLAMAPPRSLLVGTARFDRSMRAYVQMTDGSPEKDVTVQPIIRTFHPTGPLLCSSLDEERLRGTAEGARIADVCRRQVTGNGKTDELGVASVSDFTIDGPAGAYEVGLQLNGQSKVSEESYTTITRTRVTRMEVIHPDTGERLFAPPYVTAGQPLEVQPAIRVSDSSGNPQVNVKVVAFSNPDPTWPPTGPAARVPTYDRRGQRRAKFDCAVSEPSDDEGIARFKCLQVSASSDGLVNFVFSVDAFTFLPWNNPTYSPNNLYAFRVTVYRRATRLRTTVKTVEVVKPPPANVSEGSPFEVQVRLLDADGQSVEGRPCEAVLSMEYNNSLVLFFRRFIRGFQPKQLMNPSSLPSDSDGTATFSDLRFSKHGNTRFETIMRESRSSWFGMRFVCDGVQSGEVLTEVQSKVAKVVIQRFIQSEAFISKLLGVEASDGSDTLVAVVRAVDANGKGVRGKTIWVTAAGNGTLVMPVEASQESTNEAGFAVVPFRVSIAASNAVETNGSDTFQVQFIVDGIKSAVSQDLVIRLREPLTTMDCNLVTFGRLAVPRPGGNGPSEMDDVDPFTQRPYVFSGGVAFVTLLPLSATFDTLAFVSENATNLTGKVHVQVDSAYSTEGETVCFQGTCKLQVPHEPEDLIDTQIEAADQLDFWAQLQEGGYMIVPMRVSAPAGTHFIRFKTTFEVEGRAPTQCFSTPLLLDVRNSLSLITLEDDAGKVEGSFAAGASMVLTVKFVGTPPPTIMTLQPEERSISPGEVEIVFLEAPMTWQGFFSAKPYSTEEAEAYTSDGTTGSMKVRVMWRLPGIFGRFALKVSALGLNSNVYSFDLARPPNLAVRVIQEPGLEGADRRHVINCPHSESGCFITQTPLPQQPIVEVTSDGQPLNGVPVLAEIVPSTNSSSWKKLVAEQDTDVTGVYSELTNEEGRAVFFGFSIFDGEGCANFVFRIGIPDVVTAAVPATPVCFANSLSYHIVQSPPSTLPVGTQIQQLPAAKFTVRMQASGGLPFFASQGNAVARISVARLDGTLLSPGDAAAKTEELLDNNVCFWISRQELLGRCSDLVFDAAGTSATFEVRMLSWARVTQLPVTIGLLVSDLSLSPLVREANKKPIPIPFGLHGMNHAERTTVCLEAITHELNPIRTTNDIAPELVPISAVVVLPPPNIVQVGDKFLVRLRLLTKSGASARNARIMVAISGVEVTKASRITAQALEMLGKTGDKLSSFQKPGVADLESSPQAVDEEGVASFSLSVSAAKSGSYVLKFQVADPGAKVLHTTPAFIVMNPIKSVTQPAGGAWEDIEVDTFEKATRIPRRPQFQVTVPSGESLQELHDGGFPVLARVTLKGASKKLIEAKARMREYARKAADVAGSAVETGAESLVSSVRTFAVDSVTKAFDSLAPDFARECLSSGVATLQEADTPTRPASTAEAVSEDEDVVDPIHMLGQFVRTFTGGGSSMAVPSEMTAMLTEQLSIEDLEPGIGYINASNGAFVGVYTVARDIDFNFEEGASYAWSFSLNGVQADESEFSPFIVTAPKPTVMDSFVNWLVASVAGILAVLVLTTNTRKHNLLWYIPGTTATIIVIILAPMQATSVKALGGNWLVIAILNLVLVLVCLLWGAFSESPDAKLKVVFWRDVDPECYSQPFAVVKDKAFHVYAARRMILAMRDQTPPPYPTDLSIFQQVKEMVRPFNAATAFFFPSQLLVGVLLGLLSYVYVLVTAVGLVVSTRRTLESLLNKVTDSTLGLMQIIDNAYSTAMGGEELDDAATNFILTQLKLVSGWFGSLINALQVGLWTGIVVAGIVVLAVLVAALWDFRRRVLLCRRGVYTFKKEDGAVAFDNSFMGQFIASTIMGFVVIVLLCVVVLLPFVWNVSWRIIWSLRGAIFFTFIVPWILKKIQDCFIEKFLYGPTFIKHRALASIFMFWQTWLSFLTGLTDAFLRLAAALVGIIICMPQILGPCTPELLNKFVLLDGPHKCYLSAIMTYHIHNNPIVYVAVRRLMRLLEKRKLLRNDGLADEELSRRAKRTTRAMLVLFLIKRPELRKLRKAALAEQRDRASAAPPEHHSAKPTREEQAIIERIAEMEREQVLVEKKIAEARKQLTQQRQVQGVLRTPRDRV